MEVNKRIKQRRLQLELTLKDIAKALNVAESTISRYETSDIQNMGIDKIEALSKILKCTPDYLMGWKETIVEPENPQHYFLQQYLRTLKYEIIDNNSKGYSVLKTPDGEFEITESDIKELMASAESFIKFKVSEIINKYRYTQEKEDYLMPIAAHALEGATEEDMKSDFEKIKALAKTLKDKK